MTRTAYACPRCGTRLAWRRPSGSYELAPGVVAGTTAACPLVGLLCPTCSWVERVPGTAIRLSPLRRFVRRVDNPVNGADNPGS
jgi:hypothetical protein